MLCIALLTVLTKVCLMVQIKLLSFIFDIVPCFQVNPPFDILVMLCRHNVVPLLQCRVYRAFTPSLILSESCALTLYLPSPRLTVRSVEHASYDAPHNSGAPHYLQGVSLPSYQVSPSIGNWPAQVWDDNDCWRDDIEPLGNSLCTYLFRE